MVQGKVWAQGVVALTGAGRYIDLRIPNEQLAAEDNFWEDHQQPPRPQLLPLPVVQGFSNSSGPLLPTAWTFIPPDVSASGLLEVLLSPPALPSDAANPSSTPSGTVISIDAVSGSNDVRLNRGPFSSILPSPNGKLLSLLTADKILWVVSSDFQRNLSEFNVTQCEAYQDALARSPSPTDMGGLGGTAIRQIQWCGNNTVALAWDNEVVMVGPFGDSLRYHYPGSIHLTPEVDGVRIIGAENTELIQKLAESTSAVFGPGSTEPAALLYDASENFAHRSVKANEGIRAIKNQLATAVDVCIEAAGQEWEYSSQVRLLKAASLGKSFLDSRYDPSNFVEMTEKLRVINNVRLYEIGIPISWEQYEQMGITGLIARLTHRNHHLLSLRICVQMHIKPDPVLRHWARAKIARATVATAATSSAAKAQQDDELCNVIVGKLKAPGEAGLVSYSSIAASAFRAGRVRLATKLLDYEARAVDQVPLLLKMGEDKLALQKSVESGDTDLVYHVLLRLKDQLSRGDFFRVVQSPGMEINKETNPANNSNSATRPLHIAYQHLALRLLEVYAYEYDRGLLKDLYFTDDRRVEAALLALQEASTAQRNYDASSSSRKPNSPSPEEELTTFSTKLKEASKLFTEDRDRSLESKLIDEQSRLLAFQTVLEKEDGNRSTWIGLPLNDTIRECLIKAKTSTAMMKKAEKLKADFKVNEKRWGALKVDAFIRTRDWEALWNFANAKRPPVTGFELIIVKLLHAKAEKEALRYVPKVMGVGDKADKAKFK